MNSPTKNVSLSGRDDKGKFVKGNPGGPGRAQGSRNKATLLAQSQMAEKLPEVIDRLLANALDGDTTAIKVVIERLVPIAKDAPIKVHLPAIAGADDLPLASQAIVDAVADGVITPNESLLMSRLLANHIKLLEVSDIDKRIRALEERAVV